MRVLTIVIFKEKDKVFKDTITPPNNPMNEVPYVPGAFTFKGVLQLEYYGTELYCVVRGVNNNYFLMDNGVNYLFRLDSFAFSLSFLLAFFV